MEILFEGPFVVVADDRERGLSAAPIFLVRRPHNRFVPRCRRQTKEAAAGYSTLKLAFGLYLMEV